MKNLLNKHSIKLCLFALFSFTFTGCIDDDTTDFVAVENGTISFVEATPQTVQFTVGSTSSTAVQVQVQSSLVSTSDRTINYAIASSTDYPLNGISSSGVAVIKAGMSIGTTEILINHSAINSAGNYTLELTLDGETTVQQVAIIEAVCPDTDPFTLTIVLDTYPQETSWQLVNDDTSVTVASVPSGTYSGMSEETVEIVFDNLDAGNYTYTIFDTAFDGICCGYGNGSYSMGSCSLGTIFDGGEFNGSISHSFTVE